MDNIEGIKLTVVEGQPEPLVVDSLLGEKLGYQRSRDIRKLIKDLIEQGVFSDVYVRENFSRTQMPTGGIRETPIQEYLLTEEQALMVIVKSTMPKAVELTRNIIQVFQAWRKGQLTQPVQQVQIAPNDALVRQLTEALAVINNRLVEVERAVILNSESVSKAEYNALKRAICDVAQWHYLAGRYKTMRGARGGITWQLFSAIGWVGTGHRHHLLPKRLTPKAWARLEELKRDAERLVGAQAKADQHQLDLGAKL